MQHCSVSDVNRQAVQQGSGADKGDVAERALQRAIEEYRLQRPELVRTEFHSRSLEGIAGQLEQEELRQEKRAERALQRAIEESRLQRPEATTL